MSVSQADKAKKLRALHEAPRAFVIPNPWDAGSARMLAGLGYEALATSSGAKAGVLGKRDGKVTREEALANARAIAEAVDVPVIGDLEKGFGDSPDAAAETIRQAASVGLVGGSIEDATGNKDKALFDIGVAAERVAAAAKAAELAPEDAAVQSTVADIYLAQAAAALEARARDDEKKTIVTGAYLVDAERLEGRVRAAHIRERMRALGPTVRLDLGKQAEGKGAGFAAPEGE